MPELGFALSSEEHPPTDLVRWAVRAEECGFSFALISDHYHPWTDRQGHSPFVWGVIGGIAQATERLRLGTGVTCPTIRTHPGIIAQAAATAAAMMPGRFFLGVGSGENLNEHIFGDYWPAADERQEMLEEAIEVIRLLWQGGYQTHRGKHYRLENARLYSLPGELPGIAVAAAGPKAAELAASAGDALISTSPDAELVETYRNAGGDGPRYGQLTVCFDTDEQRAVKTALEWWPNAALKGDLGQELPLPRHFEQAAENVTEDEIAEVIVCGPDLDRYLEKITEFEDAGFDHVYVHQVGTDQESFFRFAERELLVKV
ncbi:MAG TPA: TIGR03557 family F420-dependent LLM class oxidoreductase [Gaiellaceae bacterium]|nr:TIGR03557 family F420-dependent LLM class oxidoreductase [Gaiellaceae bacterium]